jgi:hypothetical protein
VRRRPDEKIILEGVLVRAATIITTLIAGMLAGLGITLSAQGSDKPAPAAPVPPTADEIARGEGGTIGQHLADGRLVVPILGEMQDGGAFYALCYFEASVTLFDGKVRTVVQQPSDSVSTRKPRPGESRVPVRGVSNGSTG